MNWFLILVITLIGFIEYCCAHYFLQKTFKISDNSAHLVVGSWVLLIVLLPIKLIWSMLIVTLVFTPGLLWLSARFSRSR